MAINSKHIDNMNAEVLTTDEIFRVADLYFCEKNIMYAHSINSFNMFIDEYIRNFMLENDNTFFQRITKEKDIRHKFVFSNVSIRPPETPDGKEMFPSDARNKKYTYGIKLIGTVTQIQEVEDIYTKKIETTIIGTPEDNVPIANLPVMVRSKYCTLSLRKSMGDENKGECPYDPGCYFIVNGAEKVVISQERMCENRPLVFIKKDLNMQMYAQVNSKSPCGSGIMQVMTINLKNNGSLVLRAPILNEFPIIILFRAMGAESDREIIDYIVHDKKDGDLLDAVVRAIRLANDEKGNLIKTRVEAIDYLANKIRVARGYSEVDKEARHRQKQLHLEFLLNHNFLPHISGGKVAKLYYMGNMINRLLNCALGRIQPDDRDSYQNKRVELVGNLMDELFRQFFRKMLNECKKYFAKQSGGGEKPINVINQIRPNTIEQGIKSALSTGEWGTRARKGVAQVLQRTTYLQAIEFFRRINSPSNDAASSKLPGPRQLHGTQNGMLCPVETPEGERIGFVKHMTLIAGITVSSQSQYHVLKNIVSERVTNLTDIHPSQMLKYTKVMINGDWIGVCENAYERFIEFKNMKYNGIIHPNTSVIYDDEANELRVYCDTGRIYRPVIRVVDNAPLLTKEIISSISLNKMKNVTKITTWNELMVKHPGIIEYIDAEEQVYSMISPNVNVLHNMKITESKSIELAKNTKEIDKLNRYGNMQFIRYSHCELHPSLLLGLIATNIPFAGHNQGPRNIFQYAQGRQAMCIYMTNYRQRFDTSYILYNPHKPIVNSRTGKYMHNDVLCPGENAIVAIACYTGYNQEDSIVFNRSSIERGIFRSTSYNKYETILQKNQSSQDDIFTKPDPSKVTGMRSGTYDKLNEKGYVPEETPINNGDFIIGRVSPIQPTANNNKIYRDNSESYKHPSGVVDKVSMTYNSDGYKMIKMGVRSERIPTIGDKFCCYSPDHEVLTASGWIQIDKLKMSDSVACLRIHNKITYLEYHIPTKIQHFPYDGLMYSVNAPDVNLLVTPNHRMYVSDDGESYDIIESQCILHEHKYYSRHIDEFVPSYNDIPNCLKICDSGTISHFVLCENYLPINEWLIFIASCVSNAQVYNKCIVFDNYDESLPLSLSVMNIPFDCQNGHITVASPEIVRYICDDMVDDKSPCPSLCLPNWIKYLNTVQCKIMIDIIYKNNSQFVSKSMKMSNALQILCLHSGFSSIVSIQGDVYVISLCSRVAQVNACVEHAYDDKYIRYNGNVHCCTVPYDGIIVVRHNGKIVICGNSRHGQKGTIGLLLSQSDMPFTGNGIVPDLIISPNSIPSRMTIGHLIECLIGKVGAIKGCECDGTPFTHVDIDSIKKELEKLGYERNGNEYVYNGMTGEKMETMIFIGPTYYQRLKHLVKDKVHSRARGTKTLLLHQPSEGRTRGGGMKIGEMEKDALIAHGISKYIKEKLMDTSDAYTTYICDICGLFAQRRIKSENKAESTDRDIYECPACNNKTNISKIMIPYAFKLLVQELMSMCIAPRMYTDNDKYTH